MTEHIERYDDFMGFMAENGFVCVAHDHLGHGKTVRGDDELGFIASRDGWRIMVEDVFTVGSAIKAEYPALRMVLLGHSMGSFIARLTAFYHPYSYNALIIMGTGAKILRQRQESRSLRLLPPRRARSTYQKRLMIWHSAPSARNLKAKHPTTG